MADTKISGLAAVTDLLSTDELVLARSGTTKKIDASDFAFALGVEFGGSVWVDVPKTSDESVASSTTVQNDDELFFTTAAGTVYEINGMLIYHSPAGGGTPDLKTDWGEDSTARGTVTGTGYSNTDVNFTAAAETNQTATMVFGTATTPRVATIQGGHIGNGGTFRMRWAQFTSSGNPTIILAGSFLRYRVVV